MSDSRTGTSMCSRRGRSRTVAVKPSPATSIHGGFDPVERVEVVAQDDHRRDFSRISTTSPLRTW